MKESKREQLIRFLKKVPPEMRARLDKLKADGRRDRNRKDFLWHFLLQSFSTMGNARGWAGLIGNQENYRHVTFEALAKLSRRERMKVVQQTLLSAKVRMPAKKAQWLVDDFEIIDSLGGPGRARDLAFGQHGTAAKIAFLKQFHGIGKKYGRNIWMDVYDPDFRCTIAVDQRIKRISEVLGVTFANYEQHEQFYQEIAREAGLEPWEVDRLIYQFRDRIWNTLPNSRPTRRCSRPLKNVAAERQAVMRTLRSDSRLSGRCFNIGEVTTREVVCGYKATNVESHRRVTGRRNGRGRFGAAVFALQNRKRDPTS